MFTSLCLCSMILRPVSVLAIARTWSLSRSTIEMRECSIWTGIAQSIARLVQLPISEQAIIERVWANQSLVASPYLTFSLFALSHPASPFRQLFLAVILELVSLPQLSQPRCFLIFAHRRPRETRGANTHHRLIDGDIASCGIAGEGVHS
jgi:hypothetical protein